LKFLALETSTAVTVVAVGNEKKLLAGVSLRLERGRGDRVLELIAATLKKARLSLEELDVFGAGVGPGSFTGLRVGLSFIKGLSYSCGKPVVLFSSLDAIAMNRPLAQGAPTAVVVDARRSNVYCRFYDGAVPCSEPFMVPAEKFFKELPAEVSLRGDALAVYPGNAAKKQRWYPTPLSVAACVRREWARGNMADSFGVEAVYFYGSDCQVKKKG
jgi:tRNA threonylcarbamoyladenosine biosynthesis protein TsaB